MKNIKTVTCKRCDASWEDNMIPPIKCSNCGTPWEQTITKTEEKAFQLITISRFILARTPMILGYADHNRIINELSMMTQKIKPVFRLADNNEICESKEWEEIQKILNI